MQALMGPSGAGKSTLMDMLAMRKSVGTLSGRLLVNGKPATNSFIRQTSYVPQEDTFIPTMSCLETLSFYAGIMLGKEWCAPDRKDQATHVLSALGLGHAANTLVGGTLPGGLNLRGLSGGERRRLSIAAGILGAPSVLFLDEPTSGLDSFAALSVMGHLQNLATSRQQTVIATIHQPRSAIWEMFDMVSLLASGRLVYFGSCADMVPWFESLGLSGSVSDWVLDLVATGFDKPHNLFGHSMRTKADVEYAADAFRSSYGQTLLAAPVRAPADHLDTVISVNKDSACAPDTISVRDQEPGTEGLHSTSGRTRPSYPTRWGRQFVSLFKRELAGMTRNPFDVAARMLTSTYVALLFALFAYNTHLNTLQAIQSRGNYLFAAVNCAMLLPYISISLYTSDKKMYLADVSAKLYRPSAYYVAKVLVTLPFSVLYMLSYAGMWYGFGGLRPGAAHFWKFFCIVTLFNLIANQVLHVCAILAPNLDTTFVYSVSWTALQLPTCSFIVQFSLVYLQGLTALRYISAAYFAFEALMVNELSGGVIDCTGGIDSTLIITLTTGFSTMPGLYKNTINQLKKPQARCEFQMDAILGFMDFSRPFAVSAGILAGYLCVLHVLTYAALLLAARHDRR